jgi:hypothetical protein
MRLDRETEQIMRESGDALRITKLEEWKELRRRFFDKVFELEMSDIDSAKSDEYIGQEVRANKKAVAILKDFIQDIEGMSSTYETNNEVLEEYKNNLYDIG